MSSSIDERVVEMRFDNKQFESGAKETIDTLGKLKQSLNLEGASKGISEIDAAGRSFDMSGMLTAIGAVSSKFSALEIMGITALQRLTNAAITAGERMVHALAIDQITAGMQKYEQKTSAVQTIMHATGKSIGDVDVVLQRLNKYTDETSYSFSDMVNNIGKFTSSGVDLDVAERAMEGIANWSAASGVGIGEASRAFYNMSQAIAAGSMKMVDWKSFQMINMSTTEAKQNFMDTAVALGTLKKRGDEYVTTNGNMKVSTEQFEASLAKGWLTTDVMIQSMEKYADTSTEFGLSAYHAAQEAKTLTDAIDAIKDAISTGWMNSFELIFGNYEEAKTLFTDFANGVIETLAPISEFRNEVLGFWHDLGGREDVIEGLKESWQALGEIVQPIADAYKTIFGDAHYDTSGFDSEKHPGQAMLDPSLIEEQYRTGNKFADTLNLMSNRFKMTMKGFKANTEVMQKFQNIFEAGFSILKTGTGVLKDFGRKLKPLGSIIANVGGKFLDLASRVSVWIKEQMTSLRNSKKYKDFLSKFGTFIQNFATKFNSAFDKIWEFGGKVWTGLKGIFNNGIKPILQGVGNAVKTLWTSLKESTNWEAIGQSIGDFFSGIGDKINGEGFQGAVKAVGEFLSGLLSNVIDIGKQILNNLGIDSLEDLLKNGILVTILAGLKKFFDGLGDFGKIGEKIGDVFDSITEGIGNLTGKAQPDSLWDIAKGIAMLAAAAWVMASIPSEKLLASVGAIAALISLMVGAAVILGKAFSTGGPVTKSLEIFGKKIGQTTGVANSGANSLKKVAAAMLMLAAAVLILAIAVKVISTIQDGLWESIGAIATLVAILVVASLVLSNFGGKAAIAGGAFIGIALGVLILAAALHVVASLGDQLGATIAAVAVLAGILTIVAVIASSFGGKAALAGIGMMGMAIAILILAAALHVLAALGPDLNDLAATMMGLALGIAVAFAIISIAGVKALAAGIGMLAFAAALLILAASLHVLSALGDKLWPAIGAMAAIVAIMVVGTAILAAIGPVVLIAAAAILLFSVSIVVAAAGALMFVAALAAFSALDAPGAAIFGLAGGLIVLALAFTVAIAIMAVAAVILAVLAPVFIVAGVSATVFAVGIAAVSAALALLGLALTLVASAITGFISIFKGTSSAVQEVNSNLSDLSGRFKDIANEAEDSKEALENFGDSGSGAFDGLPEGATNAASQSQASIDGISFENVESGAAEAGEAVKAAFDPAAILNSEDGSFSDKMSSMLLGGEGGALPGFGDAGEMSGDELVSKLASSIQNGSGSVTTATDEVGSGAITTLSGHAEQAVGVGEQIDNGLAEGMSKNEAVATTAASSLGAKTLAALKASLEVASPSRLAVEVGRFFDLGFVNGMNEYARYAERAAGNMGESALSSLSDSISYINDIVNGTLDANPTIRPVLDLSNVEQGARSLDSMFSSQQAMYAGAYGYDRGNSEVGQLVNLMSRLVHAAENGGNVYLDGDKIVGYVNRGLGRL